MIVQRKYCIFNLENEWHNLKKDEPSLRRVNVRKEYTKLLELNKCETDETNEILVS